MTSKKSKRGKRNKRQQFEQRHVQGAKVEVHAQPHDEGWGTSPQAMGIVKQRSEEARHATCPECGYGGGRHSSRCGRRP